LAHPRLLSLSAVAMVAADFTEEEGASTVVVEDFTEAGSGAEGFMAGADSVAEGFTAEVDSVAEAGSEAELSVAAARFAAE
jgi:hypothetical protein